MVNSTQSAAAAKATRPRRRPWLSREQRDAIAAVTTSTHASSYALHHTPETRHDVSFPGEDEPHISGEASYPAPHPCLQDIPEASPSTGALRLLHHLSADGGRLDAAAETIGMWMTSHADVEAFSISLHATDPGEPQEWLNLGRRTWFRSWSAPDAVVRTMDLEQNPEAAALPWTGLLLHSGCPAVLIPDAELLPEVAVHDRAGLALTGTRALAIVPLLSAGSLVGSVSVSRSVPGEFSGTTVADLRVLATVLLHHVLLAQQMENFAAAYSRGSAARAASAQVIGRLAHEVVTPLAAIAHLGENISLTTAVALSAPRADDESLPVEVVEVLDQAGRDGAKIRDEAMSLRRLLGSVHESGSSPQGGSGVVRVGELFTEAAEACAAGARARRVSISIVDGADLWVTAPSTPILHALVAAVTNAVQHASPAAEPIVVSLSAFAQSSESGQLRARLSVHDDGVGLPAERAAESFEPFVKFSPAGGPGLGLTMARALVESAGGTMGMVTATCADMAAAARDIADELVTVPVGTTVWIDLPAAPRPGEA